MFAESQHRKQAILLDAKYAAVPFRENVEIRAFVSTRPLVHKHVKMSVGKWILETTRPHKHVQIPKDDFLALLQSIKFYFKSLNISNFTIDIS